MRRGIGSRLVVAGDVGSVTKVGEASTPPTNEGKAVGRGRTGALLLFALLIGVCLWLTMSGARAIFTATPALDPFYTITPRDMRLCHAPDSESESARVGGRAHAAGTASPVTLVTYVDAGSRSHTGLSNFIYAAESLGYGPPVVLGSEAGSLLGVKIGGFKEPEWKAWLRRAQEYADYAASRPPGELLVVLDAFDTLIVMPPEDLLRAYEVRAQQEVRDYQHAASAAAGGAASSAGVDADQVIVLGAERLCDTVDCRRLQLQHYRLRMEARARSFAASRLTERTRQDAASSGGDTPAKQQAREAWAQQLSEQLRYLNAGVLVGRAGALARLLEDSVRLQAAGRRDDQSSYVALAFAEPGDPDWDVIRPDAALGPDAVRRTHQPGRGMVEISKSRDDGGGGSNEGRSIAVPVPTRYLMALDYEGTVAGTVSPSPAHLEADWVNLRLADLSGRSDDDRDDDDGGLYETAAREDGKGSTRTTTTSVDLYSSFSVGTPPSKFNDWRKDAVLVRRLNGAVPSVLHVAGARQTGRREQKMNPCQVRDPVFCLLTFFSRFVSVYRVTDSTICRRITFASITKR